jgi:hypothetical protein
MNCVFCNRENILTRGHHIIPKSRGGKEIVRTCESCEDFIHSRWSHNELRDTYNNVQTILNSEDFSKFLKWLLKQKPGIKYKSKKHSDRNSRKFS